MVEFNLNGETVSLDVPPEMPLLWAIRERAGLTGTKFGCGIGSCGACTVRLDGEAARSCVTTVGSVAGRSVTTIEGLGSAGNLHPVQAAWVEHQVPQCGYCQSGVIMAVASLLEHNPEPTDEELESAVGNICRCGTYERIRAAVRSLAPVPAPSAGGEGSDA